MSEWQDISTAPKDGRDLILAPGCYEAVTFGFYAHGHWKDSGAQFETGCGGLMREDINPTHWQPLPSPPTNLTGGK